MRKSRFFTYMIILIALAAGCERAAEATPSATVAAAAEVTQPTTSVAEVSSALPTPAPAAEMPTVTPTSAPAAPLPVEISVPTPLPFPQPYTPDGEPIQGAPIPAAPLVICNEQDEGYACYDELLGLKFTYPTFMGPIGHTMLRQGGQGGYAYEYMFTTPGSNAGGRSRDFAEGRGGMFTDQFGFGGSTAEELCANSQAAICQAIGPGVVFQVLLPQAEWLCSDAMAFTVVPHGLLLLDLPQHPLIHGFGFSVPLLSEEAATAFQAEWYSSEKQCLPETKPALESAMTQLRQELQAGSAAPELQTRYDALIRLGESVQAMTYAAP